MRHEHVEKGDRQRRDRRRYQLSARTPVTGSPAVHPAGSVELRGKEILIGMLRFPFAGTDEADALTPGIGIENPGDLAHIPQGWLVAIDIAIAFHHSARKTLLGYGAEDLFIAVRRTPSYHAALATVAEPRGAE
jgi:hypothetical protein